MLFVLACLLVINKFAITKFNYPGLGNQPCPSKLTFVSLLIIMGGAVGYVATDSAFTLTACSWAFAYLVAISTEMVYIKRMVTNHGLNTFGFVFGPANH